MLILLTVSFFKHHSRYLRKSFKQKSLLEQRAIRMCPEVAYTTDLVRQLQRTVDPVFVANVKWLRSFIINKSFFAPHEAYTRMFKIEDVFPDRKMDDEAVIATNDDASECKRGAVQLGYWQDNYIPYFIKQSQRRAPEINRGYYARVKGVEKIIHKFLSKAGGNAQIINLGSGFDTLYWRLKDQEIKLYNFVEIDFPSVTSRKCYLIKRNKQLLQRIHEKDQEVKLSQTDLHAGPYHCIGADLRNIGELENKLHQAEVNFAFPTLFIAECVLVYIENDCVSRLLSWIASKFPNCLFIVYEMCNMNDTFGNVMLENLRVRGCNLAGISSCKNLETQQMRFQYNNWVGSKAWDMVSVYYSLPTSERQRIEKLEFLDEQELLIQLFQHYCICLGWMTPEFADCDFE